MMDEQLSGIPLSDEERDRLIELANLGDKDAQITLLFSQFIINFLLRQLRIEPKWAFLEKSYPRIVFESQDTAFRKLNDSFWEKEERRSGCFITFIWYQLRQTVSHHTGIHNRQLRIEAIRDWIRMIDRSNELIRNITLKNILDSFDEIGQQAIMFVLKHGMNYWEAARELGFGSKFKTIRDWVKEFLIRWRNELGLDEMEMDDEEHGVKESNEEEKDHDE